MRRPARLRSALRPACALVAASTLAPVAGCSSSTSTALPYTPFTGVTIDSASLAAPYGCGTAPGQVYRYVAEITCGGVPPSGDSGATEVLTQAAQSLSDLLLIHPSTASGVFDCFAEGVFEALPPAPATCAIQIYAYTFEGLPAALMCDASPCVPPPLAAGAPGTAPLAGYQWMTSCEATEVSGAAVVADCTSLRPAVAAGSDAGPKDGAVLE